MLWITKMVLFSPKPMAFTEGSPFSCFYNFKWSEISIDWKGVALLLLSQIQWNNSMGRLNDNDSYLIDPLLEKHLCPHLQEFGKIYIFKYLEKKINTTEVGGTDVYPPRDPWKWNLYHSVFLFHYFILFEFIIKVLAFSLPLLLFHFN